MLLSCVSGLLYFCALLCFHTLVLTPFALQRFNPQHTLSHFYVRNFLCFYAFYEFMYEFGLANRVPGGDPLGSISGWLETGRKFDYNLAPTD